MLEAFIDVWSEVGVYVIGAGLLYLYSVGVELYRRARRRIR